MEGTCDIRCSIDDSTGVPLSDFKKDSSPGADAADAGAMAAVVCERGAGYPPLLSWCVVRRCSLSWQADLSRD
jgi:hypothetical protein